MFTVKIIDFLSGVCGKIDIYKNRLFSEAYPNYRINKTPIRMETNTTTSTKIRAGYIINDMLKNILKMTRSNKISIRISSKGADSTEYDFEPLSIDNITAEDAKMFLRKKIAKCFKESNDFFNFQY